MISGPAQWQSPTTSRLRPRFGVHGRSFRWEQCRPVDEAAAVRPLLHEGVGAVTVGDRGGPSFDGLAGRVGGATSHPARYVVVEHDDVHAAQRTLAALWCEQDRLCVAVAQGRDRQDRVVPAVFGSADRDPHGRLQQRGGGPDSVLDVVPMAEDVQRGAVVTRIDRGAPILGLLVVEDQPIAVADQHLDRDAAAHVLERNVDVHMPDNPDPRVEAEV